MHISVPDYRGDTDALVSLVAVFFFRGGGRDFMLAFRRKELVKFYQHTVIFSMVEQKRTKLGGEGGVFKLFYFSADIKPNYRMSIMGQK